MHIAHINQIGNIQTCDEHCKNVAEIASKNIECIELKNVAYLSGILHDMGKFSNEFDSYINDAFSGKNVNKGSVIHSFTGLSYLLTSFHKTNCNEDVFYSNVTAEIISFAIAAHHGLFDCINEDGVNGFDYRLNKQKNYDLNAIEEFKKECLCECSLRNLFSEAISEVRSLLEKLAEIANTDEEIDFYSGMLTRLVLSAVIDADRQDTYEFMSGKKIPLITSDWNKCLCSIEAFLNGKEQKSLIQISRRELSNYCYEFASKPSDIYRLNIPTGSGKTLSGLRYAIKHAQLYSKKRIIYIAPLISILEQNAAVIKEAVGEENVFEHHSNVINENDDGEEITVSHLLTENWNAPIIVTTLVQFLDTLFMGKTSNIRRMVSLVDSVIIIDEVQSVPYKMLSLFNLAINFLKNVCKTSILLCSATQPVFESIEHSMLISKESILTKEIEHKYYEVFKRCKIQDAGRFRLEDIPFFLRDITENINSLLVVCNKKKEAEYLYTVLSETYACCHLSASMCMEHRVDTLNKLVESLSEKKKIICIATQVIEAGVDVSFEAVVRFNAGIDNIVQAAGRCNRNGEQGTDAVTYVIDCIDESLTGLEDIKRAQDSTRELLYRFKAEPAAFDFDLASQKAVTYYYNNLYHELSIQSGYFDYVKGRYPSVFELLSDNSRYLSKKNTNPIYFINQAFKTAGEIYEPLETDTVTVIVPYMDGKNLIGLLGGEEAKYNIQYARKLIDQLKRYSVSIMRYQYDWLKKENGVYSLLDGSVLVLMEEYYDASTGVVTERKENICNTLIL